MYNILLAEASYLKQLILMGDWLSWLEHSYHTAGVTGSNPVSPTDTIEYISNLAESVSVLKTLEIPNCDHQLKGNDNSKILSKLPEHFFLEEYKERDFPNKEDGFNLLDEDLPLKE